MRRVRSRVMDFVYIAPPLNIELVGHFSIDGDLQYRADLSQLKYYIPPSNPEDVNFDLNINLESSNHKPTWHSKLDNILRWISDHFDEIERPLLTQESRWLDPNFISSRGTLITVLSSLHTKADWVIYASKYRGTIYLYEHHSDEKECSQANAATSAKQTSSGFKFKQYMIADHPSDKPNPLVSRNECEKFYCMFKTYFDDYILLYSARIDGISSEQPITDTLIGKTCKWVGLKIFRMRSGTIYSTPGPVSKCWSANYLIGSDKIVIGFKNPNNIVKSIKECSEKDLLKVSKPYCDVNKCKLFLKKFLDDVKIMITEDYDKCIYKLEWRASNKMVTYNGKIPVNTCDEKHILKSWFINKAEEYRQNRGTANVEI